MLTENKLDMMEYPDIKKFDKDVFETGFWLYCPSCGTLRKIESSMELEDMVVTYNHNPSDEHIICPTCSHDYSLLNHGMKVILGDEQFAYLLMSDGNNLFLKDRRGEFYQI